MKKIILTVIFTFNIMLCIENGSIQLTTANFLYAQRGNYTSSNSGLTFFQKVVNFISGGLLCPNTNGGYLGSSPTSASYGGGGSGNNSGGEGFGQNEIVIVEPGGYVFEDIEPLPDPPEPEFPPLPPTYGGGSDENVIEYYSTRLFTYGDPNYDPNTATSPPDPCQIFLNASLPQDFRIGAIQEFVAGRPLGLFTIDDITSQKWVNLANYTPPATNLNNAALVLSSDAISRVKSMTAPYSQITNLDYFPVKITTLPIINGHRLTANELLEYVRLHLNDFIDNTTMSITPYDASNLTSWNTSATRGNGTVLRTSVNRAPSNSEGVLVASSDANEPNNFKLTTLKDPLYTGAAPRNYNSNREFGYTTNTDGSYTFYSKGVDRAIGGESKIFENAVSGTQAENFDPSGIIFQAGLEDFTNRTNGNAKIEDFVIYRPDFNKIRAVIEGSKPLCAVAQNLSNIFQPDNTQNSNQTCVGCSEKITSPVRIAYSFHDPGKIDHTSNIDAEDMGYCDITNDNTTMVNLGLNQAEVYNISEWQLRLRMLSLVSKTSILDLFMLTTNVNLVKKFYKNDHPENNFRDKYLDTRIAFHSSFEKYSNPIVDIVKRTIENNLVTSSNPLSGADAEYRPPLFDDLKDKFNGLGIAIHDVWSAKGEVTSLKICTSNRSYCVNIKFSLFDDYGLDKQDVIKNNQVWSANIPLFWTKDGFHAWYILQHFKCPSRNVDYSLHRPFITEVVINVPFNGVY